MQVFILLILKLINCNFITFLHIIRFTGRHITKVQIDHFILPYQLWDSRSFAPGPPRPTRALHVTKWGPKNHLRTTAYICRPSNFKFWIRPWMVYTWSIDLLPIMFCMLLKQTSPFLQYHESQDLILHSYPTKKECFFIEQKKKPIKN